ncbi:restriction endonuclease subunit S [Mesomycoplasma hyorhinis]|uniref:restriction endonuclease subunit S n=1 Tax=Mesomycoplasma hyorhinis TaxID=2100 RepID=UPI001C05A93F|nr:restriction endonuclease subunit S [Mesomycoplasma hyorhinis]
MKKALKPEIRFNDFTDDWIEGKVEDLFELDGGGFVSKKEILENPGKYPVYSSQTTNNGTMGYISTYRYDLECLTWTTRGYAGVVFYRNEKFNVSNSGLLTFKNNFKYDYKYFAFVFQNSNIQSLITAGSIPQFTVEMMKDVVLNYSTNIFEQQKIASLFYTLDKIVSLYERKMSLLEKLEKSLIFNIFTKKNEGKPSIRFFGFKEDWQSWKLENKGFLYSGLTSKSKEDFANGNSKYISYLNVYSNFNTDLKDKSSVFIKPDDKQNTIEKGDILFTMSSETYQEVGLSSVVTEEVNEKIYLNSFCFGYRLNETNFLFPNFASFLFRNDAVRNEIIFQSNGGTSRFNLSKKSFLNIKIKTPQIEEQQKISSLLDTLHITHAQLKRKLNLIKNIQKSLLNKMFV